MKQTDVLNLEWHSGPTRDNYISTLVCNYLSIRGYKVKRGCIFNGIQQIVKYKPILVFLANGIGAPENHDIVKFAKKFGCKVVTGISEGNIQPSNISQMTWGWNKKQKLIEDLNLQWSFRAKNITLQHNKINSDKIKVSGGIGFDIYKIKNDEENVKNNFCNKYNIPINKNIIGFACWDFGPYYKEDHRYKTRKNRLTEEEFNQRKNDGIELNQILYNFIQKNNHYHFIIKEHPGSLLGEKASAIKGLSKFSNVTIIKHQEAAETCIKASDIWLGYETTTAMEAWLLNRTTILINPSGPDFERASIYKGSIIVKNEQELQNRINEFFQKGYIEKFLELKELRKLEIEKVIQWSDGLNHKRAGNFIVELLQSTASSVKLETSKLWKKNILKSFLKEILINNKITGPLFFRGRHNFTKKKLKAFNPKEMKKFENEILKYQIEFYKNENCCN